MFVDGLKRDLQFAHRKPRGPEPRADRVAVVRRQGIERHQQFIGLGTTGFDPRNQFVEIDRHVIDMAKDVRHPILIGDAEDRLQTARAFIQLFDDGDGATQHLFVQSFVQHGHQRRQIVVAKFKDLLADGGDAYIQILEHRHESVLGQLSEIAGHLIQHREQIGLALASDGVAGFERDVGLTLADIDGHGRNQSR